MPEIKRYVDSLILSFADDKPDSEHQRGYLAALFEVKREIDRLDETEEVVIN